MPSFPLALKTQRPSLGGLGFLANFRVMSTPSTPPDNPRPRLAAVVVSDGFFKGDLELLLEQLLYARVQHGDEFAVPLYAVNAQVQHQVAHGRLHLDYHPRVLARRHADARDMVQGNRFLDLLHGTNFELE